jgi:hypothetical protein
LKNVVVSLTVAPAKFNYETLTEDSRTLALAIAAFSIPGAPLKGKAPGGKNIKHVLLISIDGMHELDFANCSKGLNSIDGGTPYCPNLLSHRMSESFTLAAPRKSPNMAGLHMTTATS